MDVVNGFGSDSPSTNLVFWPVRLNDSLRLIQNSPNLREMPHSPSHLLIRANGKSELGMRATFRAQVLRNDIDAVFSVD